MPKPKRPAAIVNGPFEIRALSATETDVFIYGDIGPSWNEDSVTAAQFVRDLQNIDAKTINVRINSVGGSVRDALAIYNALTRHPATVNTHVDGLAASSASLIAMAGETAYMAANALLMVHGPMAMAEGNSNTMREAAAILDKFAQAMAPSYASKTGKPVAEMLALLTDGVDHFYTATEAQAFGFTDEITAAVEVMATFDLSRFRGVPAAVAALFSKENTMPQANTTTAAAPTPAVIDVTAAAVPAVPAAAPAAVVPAAATPAAAAPALAVVGALRTVEQNREIRAAFQPFIARDTIRALYDDVIVDSAITVDTARARLLAALGTDAAPANAVGTAARVEMGESEADKFRAACTVSILARAGYATQEQRATLGANPYRGHRLADLARASLERRGVSTRGLSQMDIVAAAFTQSTSDFPVLLEDAMRKALLSAYALAPDVWSQFCARGSVTDFRASNRYRIGSFGSLDSLNELGEFHNKSIPDGEKSTITAGTKGNIINLSRQAIINDDLGAFVGLAAMLGRAGRRTVEVDVFALLAENSGAGPTMSDGHALFSSDHANNAGSGTAPSVATIDAGRVAMASQLDISGNDYLDIRPSIWLGPMATGGTMRVVNASEYDPDTADKLQRPNMVRGLLRSIVDTPRIATADWYLFADPTVAPVIEVAFLDGNDTPFIEQQNGFTVDGTQYKVRLDYGVAAVDFRGGYRNAGD